MKNMNQVANIEKAIQNLQDELQDLFKVRTKLEKTFEYHHQEENLNEPRVKELQRENHDMR